MKVACMGDKRKATLFLEGNGSGPEPLPIKEREVAAMKIYKVQDFVVICGLYCYAEPTLASPANTLFCPLVTPHKNARLQRGNQLVGCLETSGSELWSNDGL